MSRIKSTQKRRDAEELTGDFKVLVEPFGRLTIRKTSKGKYCVGCITGGLWAVVRSTHGIPMVFNGPAKAKKLRAYLCEQRKKMAANS